MPVALAAGLWRVERDRPAWLLPGMSVGAAPAGAPPPLAPRLVLAVHYPWYGTPAGPAGRWWHWNHARLGMPEPARILGFHDPGRSIAPGRRDLGATHYPEDGPYDSRDPARIRCPARQARAAGLDGLAVSWWGHEREEALGLAALFRHAGEAGLVLAPYYETGGLRRRGALGVAADLEILLDRHGSEPAWLRVGGAPVVFLYASHLLRPAAWDAVRARLTAGGRRLFLVADVRSPEWLAARPEWLSRFDALHVYTTVEFLARGRDLGQTYGALAALARAAGRPFVPAVAPGYDDRRVREPGPRHRARQRGDLRAKLAGGPVGRSRVGTRVELERVARGQRDRAERGARAPVPGGDPPVGRAIPPRRLTRGQLATGLERAVRRSTLAFPGARGAREPKASGP